MCLAAMLSQAWGVLTLVIRPCSCPQKLPCWGSSYPTPGTLPGCIRSTCNSAHRGRGLFWCTSALLVLTLDPCTLVPSHMLLSFSIMPPRSAHGWRMGCP